MFQEFKDLLQDGSGRIVGSVTTKRRPLTRVEREYCSAFIETVSRGRKAVETVTANMKANALALAGEIKKLKTEKSRGWFLLDCGPDSNRNKSLPCTIWDDEELARKLARFQEGDYIQVKGHVRIWAQKNEETGDWTTKIEARVESIKNDPPERKEQPKQQQGGGRFEDDGLPW